MTRWLWTLPLLALLVACGSGSEPGDADGNADGPAAPDVAPPPPDPEAARLLEEGVALVETDPKKAIEVLTKSLAKQETARGYLARARANLATAEAVLPGVIPPDVAPDLEAALRLDPDSPEALFFKAELLGLGRNDAQGILERLADMEIAADDGLGLFIRARAASLLRDEPKEKLRQADRDFAAAAKLRRKDAELRLRWGSFLIRKIKDEDRAENVLRACVALDPDGRYGREAQRLLDDL